MASNSLSKWPASLDRFALWIQLAHLKLYQRITQTTEELFVGLPGRSRWSSNQTGEIECASAHKFACRPEALCWTSKTQTKITHRLWTHGASSLIGAGSNSSSYLVRSAIRLGKRVRYSHLRAVRADDGGRIFCSSVACSSACLVSRSSTS